MKDLATPTLTPTVRQMPPCSPDLPHLIQETLPTPFVYIQRKEILQCGQETGRWRGRLKKEPVEHQETQAPETLMPFSVRAQSRSPSGPQFALLLDQQKHTCSLHIIIIKFILSITKFMFSEEIDLFKVTIS